MPKQINLINKKIGRLTVLSQAPKINGLNAWNCICDCGNNIIATTKRLRRNGVHSCGCFKTERAINLGHAKRTHGQKHTRLYHIWRNMKSRCYYEKDISYPRYGGRGITICPEWENCFETFRDWAVATGYADNLTIDRIDVNGDYCPGNCKWSTMKEQARNRRDNIVYKGKTVAEWCEIRGIDSQTVYTRIKIGWSVERAINTPLLSKVNNSY